MVSPSVAGAEASLPDGCGSARETASAAAALTPLVRRSASLPTSACSRQSSLDADLQHGEATSPPEAWRGTNEAVRDLHRNLHQIEVESGAFSPASSTPQQSGAEANSAQRIQQSRSTGRIKQSRSHQEWDVSAARFRLYPEIGTVCQAGLEPQASRRQTSRRQTGLLRTRLSPGFDSPGFDSPVSTRVPT